VWHWNVAIYNWCNNTPSVTINGSTNAFRIVRGRIANNHVTAFTSSSASVGIGFRPALQYIEEPATTLFD
jgi:hypothetical protein